MNDSFIIANRTDVGKVREVNEDCMTTFDSPNGRVVAVCDGMGGQAAGDVASRLACDIITDILSNNKFRTPTEAITRACMAANQGIVHKAAQNPELEGMGATCVLVIIKDGLVYYGWVGDSRIYYITPGSIRQITRDQSYVQQLVDQGVISAEEAEHHPQKNQILNALGLPNMTPPELCAVPLTPEPGSVILLCSDGLSGMIDNQQIERIVSDPNMNLQRKADKLVEQAILHGGSDNITVQLIQFGKAGAMPKGAKKSLMQNAAAMWALIGVAAVVVAGFIVWLCLSPKEEPAPVVAQPPVQQTAPATKKPDTNPAPQAKSSTKVEKTTTTVKEPSSKVQTPKKGNKIKTTETQFGGTGKQSDKSDRDRLKEAQGSEKSQNNPQPDLSKIREEK